ncbi:trehalose 6-phosphate synthase/phosphatase [Nematocida sp. ERTm5]|nr:trehalose 6-phosphate synthase/phosphatase [Nematocida sp. ERTm5]
MNTERKTIILSGNLPIHCKDRQIGFYAPSYSSVGASMLYGSAEENRAKTTFIGISHPDGMPSYKTIQPTEFKFLPVETEKNPKDLVFSQHLSQACHHSLGRSALFPKDLEEPYNDYVQFNQDFFSALKTVYSYQDTIIILGKHLLMLPELIRKEFPLAKITLVFICPFPAYELFSCIPYSKDIMLSMLMCDRLELQSENYLENFISTAFLLVNAQTKELSEKSLEVIKGSSSLVFIEKEDAPKKSEKKSQMLPYEEEKKDMLTMLTTSYKTSFLDIEDESLLNEPINIEEHDEQAVKEYLEDTMPIVEKLSKKEENKMYVVYVGNSRALVTVASKHAPKKYIEEVQSSKQYNDILEKIKETKKDRKFVMVIETTRKVGSSAQNLLSVLKYLQKNPNSKVDFIRCVVYGESVAFHNTELSGLAEQISSLYPTRFTTIIFPTTYLYFALLELADICIAGAPTDSISLVAYEYACINRKGKLIVPYSSGIAFKHAIYTLNCPDITAEVIKNALKMKDQKEEDFLEGTDEWMRSLHHILRVDPPCGTEQIGKIPQHLAKNVLEEKESIKSAYKESKKRTIFLDYDGTLTEIVPNPKDAKPTEEILGILQKLTEDKQNNVFIVTGRGKEEAEEWFGHLNIQIYAEHGTYKKENEEWITVPCDISWKETAIKIIEEYVSYTPGSAIEVKNTCVVFHCKDHGRWCANALQRMLGTQARVVTGKNIVEVRPKGIDKGSCIEKESYYDGFTLCAGDDATDEDMFMVLLNAPDTYTICVGERTTCASLRAGSPKELRALLKSLYE